MSQQIDEILIVEDRADWQDILQTALTQQGFAVHAAPTYQDALDILDSREFGLAIIDPVLDRENRFNRDGISIVQKLRESYPNVPVVILTGSLTSDMKISLKHLYPDAPIFYKERWDPTEFNHTIQSLAGQSQIGAQTGQADDAEKHQRPQGPLTPPTPEDTVGKPRVLLVENRVDWQEIVASTLDGASCFWRVASNAEQALAEMEKEGFHLVILDLKLQKGELPLRSNEGWLLLDYLIEQHPKTKVLILSGRAGPSDVADLLTQYPVIGFMEKKNFKPGAILDAVMQSDQSPLLRIQTFGQFQIWRDGKAVGIWERPQAETIAKLLLVRCARGGRAVAADELITRLWPDDDQESGRKKLLPLISNARHTLEPDIEPRDSHFILRSTNGYYFDVSESVTWDLFEFREHLQVGKQMVKEERWEVAIEQLQKGRALYRGDFLAEDRYADWAMDIRRQITAEFCDLLIQLADAHAALENYPEAINACEAALGKDPLLESVYRRLMSLHYCNGEKGQAMKVYRDCMKLFDELFGESPNPATHHLHQAISNDEPFECPPHERFDYTS